MRLYSCLSYKTCKVYVPYCHLWTDRLYHIFPHYLTKRYDFRGTVIEHKMRVLIFSTTFVSDFEVHHPRCVSNKSNYKVYVYIARHNYILYTTTLYIETYCYVSHSRHSYK